MSKYYKYYGSYKEWYSYGINFMTKFIHTFSPIDSCVVISNCTGFNGYQNNDSTVTRIIALLLIALVQNWGR